PTSITHSFPTRRSSDLDLTYRLLLYLRIYLEIKIERKIKRVEIALANVPIAINKAVLREVFDVDPAGAVVVPRTGRESGDIPRAVASGVRLRQCRVEIKRPGAPLIPHLGSDTRVLNLLRHPGNDLVSLGQ